MHPLLVSLVCLTTTSLSFILSWKRLINHFWFHLEFASPISILFHTCRQLSTNHIPEFCHLTMNHTTTRKRKRTLTLLDTKPQQAPPSTQNKKSTTNTLSRKETNINMSVSSSCSNNNNEYNTPPDAVLFGRRCSTSSLLDDCDVDPTVEEFMSFTSYPIYLYDGSKPLVPLALQSSSSSSSFDFGRQTRWRC